MVVDNEQDSSTGDCELGYLLLTKCNSQVAIVRKQLWQLMCVSVDKLIHNWASS